MSIKHKSISVLVPFLLFFLAIAWADSPITINTKIDKQKTTTGDIVTYTIILKHDLNVTTSKPNFSVIDKFDVLETVTSEPRKNKNKIEQDYSVKLRADKIGNHSIPPISVPFKVIERDTSKSIPGEIRSPEVIIEVASVLRLYGEPADIRDIKGLVEVNRNWTPWFFWGLNLLLLIVVLYLFWKYRKIKHKKFITETQALPTHEIALRELDTLKRKRLLDRGGAREHFFELSEIFRRYLGKRYLFPASDWTTEEISEYFQKQEEIELTSRVEANRILSKSDLIKFAKAQASPGADEIESVRKFIISTRKNLNLGLYSN